MNIETAKQRWTREHRDILLELKKKDYQRRLKESKWLNNYYSARARCLNPKNNMYYLYGGRGIKFLMTKEDFKYLWFRDKAECMKKPSIDRINEDGNYEVSNCQFIEMSENSKKVKNRFQKRT